MNLIREYNPIEQTASKLLPGLDGLAAYVDQTTFIYVLQSVYGVVFKSSSLKESKNQLQQRIIQFEKDSALPGFMSALSIDQLLEELEDAQYLYPVCRREVSLPKFH